MGRKLATIELIQAELARTEERIRAYKHIRQLLNEWAKQYATDQYIAEALLKLDRNIYYIILELYERKHNLISKLEKLKQA